MVRTRAGGVGGRGRGGRLRNGGRRFAGRRRPGLLPTGLLPSPSRLTAPEHRSPHATSAAARVRLGQLGGSWGDGRAVSVGRLGRRLGGGSMAVRGRRRCWRRWRQFPTPGTSGLDAQHSVLGAHGGGGDAARAHQCGAVIVAVNAPDALHAPPARRPGRVLKALAFWRDPASVGSGKRGDRATVECWGRRSGKQGIPRVFLYPSLILSYLFYISDTS